MQVINYDTFLIFSFWTFIFDMLKYSHAKRLSNSLIVIIFNSVLFSLIVIVFPH